MRLKQIINIRHWQERKLSVGHGTRDKVVLKMTNKGKVYFIAKTYHKDIGELRSEVCASNIGRLFGFSVQRTWLCKAPQYRKLGLRHSSCVLIQLDVRRQRYTKRNQFRENLIHGGALISEINKKFSRLKSDAEGRKFYTLELVIEALRQYVRKNSEAAIVWQQFFDMLTLDALIGGTDRHYNNWGILEKADEGKFLRLAPAFDNGISLLWKENHADFFTQDIMRNSFSQNFPRRARSIFKKNGIGNYTLYELLEVLYSIPEYRNTKLATNILSRISAVSGSQINRVLLLNIPQKVRFKTDKRRLGLISQYVKIRLEILKMTLSVLAQKYD